MDVFEESWKVMEIGIAKLKAILAGEPVPQFTSEEYMELYRTIYDLCKRSDNCQRAYDNYKLTFEDYVSSTVLPFLQEKHGELLLREFATRLSNLKVMARWMSRFFQYLHRYYIAKKKLAGLNEVPVICFRDMVYANMKGKICDALLFLIDQEREGHEVDRALLKNVVDIFIDVGMGQMQYYENDFEAPMLEQTATHYSQNASKYSLQVDECLKDEKDRVSHYLHPSSEPKLLKRVRQELGVDWEEPQLQDREEPQLQDREEMRMKVGQKLLVVHTAQPQLQDKEEPHLQDREEIIMRVWQELLVVHTAQLQLQDREEMQMNLAFSHRKAGQMDDLDGSWNVMEKGIAKLKAILAGEPELAFTSEEYMELYITIYKLCSRNTDNCPRAYGNYMLTFEDYVSSTVLPSLQEKHGELLLRDFATRWSNHKVMARWLSHFFHYLDRFYVVRKKLATLNEVSVICFRDMVYANMKGKICDAVLFLIDQEREGNEVD